MIRNKEFRYFDYGKEENLKIYNTTEAPFVEI